MVTRVELLTALVVMVKAWVLTPGAKFNVPGTVTAALLLLRDTPTPLQGAPRVRVTVPVEDCPPVTELGLSVTLATKVLPPSALMVNWAWTEAPP
jgi:hypothetical protein